MCSQVQKVISSSLTQFLYFTGSVRCLGQSTFPLPPPPFVYVKVFILLSRLCRTVSMTSMGKQMKTAYAPRVLGLGLPQANLSLFGPVALVYPSRQHQKADSYDRYAWLEWKSGAYVWWS